MNTGNVSTNVHIKLTIFAGRKFFMEGKPLHFPLSSSVESFFFVIFNVSCLSNIASVSCHSLINIYCVVNFCPKVMQQSTK